MSTSSAPGRGTLRVFVKWCSAGTAPPGPFRIPSAENGIKINDGVVRYAKCVVKGVP